MTPAQVRRNVQGGGWALDPPQVAEGTEILNEAEP
jgi:hypothetical protein